MTTLPDFDAVHVLCVGDVMLDRFVHGTVERVSPEAPVPVVLLGTTARSAGGAANVGRNVVALGGHCSLVGAVGADAAGEELARLLAGTGGISPRLVVEPGSPTTEKTRFLAMGQHLLRADSEEPGELSASAEAAVLAAIGASIGGANVVVLSDYAKGVLTDRVAGKTIDLARSRGLPVVVDPKGARLERYRGASVVVPNSREAQLASSIDVKEDADAQRAAERIVECAGLKAVLVTRAERGMTLVQSSAPTLHIPASARRVFDVVGAGDTVVAVLALCLGAGLPLSGAARLANTAGGIVVGKQGTGTVNRMEMLDELARLSRLGSFPAEVKVLDRTAAAAQRASWGRDGLRVGFTNGCFDILHIGHVRLLECLRARCDRLIVGINSDASIRRLKGPTRPINPLADRAQLLAALAIVDAVVPFEEDAPAALVEALAPDLLAKGSDYRSKQIAGAESVLARGGEVLTFDLLPGRSTTAILERARARHGASA